MTLRELFNKFTGSSDYDDLREVSREAKNEKNNQEEAQITESYNRIKEHLMNVTKEDLQKEADRDRYNYTVHIAGKDYLGNYVGDYDIDCPAMERLAKDMNGKTNIKVPLRYYRVSACYRCRLYYDWSKRQSFLDILLGRDEE